MSKQKTEIVQAQVVPADPLQIDPTLDRAGRINKYHNLSREAGRISIAAAIAAGVELEMAMAELPKGQFDAWVNSYCEFGRSTAYKYRAAARAVLGDRLQDLLDTSDQCRRETVEAAATSLDSATLTELYVDAGIVQRAPSRMGGKRPGAGRKPKSLQEQAKEIATDPDLAMDEFRGLMVPVFGFAVNRDGFGLLRDDDLATACGVLKEILMRAEELLKTRKGGRK